MKNKITAVLSILLAVFVFGNHTIGAYALSKEQRKLLQSGVYYFNAEVDGDSSCQTSGSGSSGPATGDTYVLGDSIAQGLSSTDFAQQLSAVTNGSTTFNYDQGRSIKNPGTGNKTSALTAVEQDQAKIKAVKNIIIILGTNPENNFEQSLKDLLAVLKNLNANAQYYWVDIGATRADLATTWSGYNKIIYDNSATIGYKVISRYKAIFGNDKDPLNIDPGLSIPPGGGDNVHGASSQLSAAIIEFMKTGGGNGGCACTLLAGKDNPEKIWNYLITKGLTPPQAAGIMGNLQAESGFRPTAEQTAGAWENMSNDYRAAVGIAQWDGPRRVRLINAAKDQNKDKKDLGFQLDYLYKESNGRSSPYPGLSEWEGLKKQENSDDAAFYWHKYFEVSADSPSKIQGRLDNARNILLQYGSGANTSGGAGSC